MLTLNSALSACTAERFFRVDRAQEHLHYLTDVASEALYVLDTLPQTPDDETAFCSPATSNHQSPSSLLGDQITPELRSVQSLSEQIISGLEINDFLNKDGFNPLPQTHFYMI